MLMQKILSKIFSYKKPFTFFQMAPAIVCAIFNPQCVFILAPMMQKVGCALIVILCSQETMVQNKGPHGSKATSTEGCISARDVVNVFTLR